MPALTYPPLLLPDGRSLRLDAGPLVMGIVNVTPDSFSDGGLFAETPEAVEHGVRLAGEGADIIDIGGESTRPGHAPLSLADELARVMPVLSGVLSQASTPVSIDTYKADVARAALQAGAQIVNDVWGAQREPAIARVAAEAGAPIILMHNRETTDPAIDILDDVRRFLEKSMAIALAAGVPHSQIVIDPGIGLFGKTQEQSLTLIRQLDRLLDLGAPVLLGVSRKSTIGALIGRAVPRERLAGSIAANLYGIRKGAAIIRVHDVHPHVDALKVWSALGADA